MIDKNKKYRTQDGHSVTILTTERKHHQFPVIGLIHERENFDYVCCYTIAGISNSGSNTDLIEVKEKKTFEDEISVVIFKNGSSIYTNNPGRISLCKQDPNVVAILMVPLRVEYEEGEGKDG